MIFLSSFYMADTEDMNNIYLYLGVVQSNRNDRIFRKIIHDQKSLQYDIKCLPQKKIYSWKWSRANMVSRIDFFLENAILYIFHFLIYVLLYFIFILRIKSLLALYTLQLIHKTCVSFQDTMWYFDLYIYSD